MKDNAQDISKELLELPPTDRAYIAKTLLVSLDEGDGSDQEAIDAEWKLLIARRVAEHAAGEIETIPAEVTISRLRDKLTNARRAAS